MSATSSSSKTAIVIDWYEIQLDKGGGAVRKLGVFLEETTEKGHTKKTLIGSIFRHGNERSRWRWRAEWKDNGTGGQLHGTAPDKPEAARLVLEAWNRQNEE